MRIYNYQDSFCSYYLGPESAGPMPEYKCLEYDFQGNTVGVVVQCMETGRVRYHVYADTQCLVPLNIPGVDQSFDVLLPGGDVEYCNYADEDLYRIFTWTGYCAPGKQKK